LKSLIESTISWNKIGKHTKDSYRFNIEKAVVSKETAVLSMDIRLNFVIPFSDVDRITEIIKNEITGLQGVSLHFIYEDVILTKERFLKHLIEHMIHEINGSYAAVTKTIFQDDFSLENGQLTIMALGAVAVSELNDKVATQFEKYIKRDFDIDLNVVFANHEDSYQQKAKEKAELAKKELEEADKVQKLAAASGNGPTGGNKAGNGFGGMAAPAAEKNGSAERKTNLGWETGSWGKRSTTNLCRSPA